VEHRPEPDGRLAPAARMVWTVEALLWGVPVAAAAIWFGALLRREGGALHDAGVVLPWLALLVVFIGVFVAPTLEYRRWRWRLDDDELDLRHGAVTEIRSIIPVARIQHVDIKRTFVARLWDVAAVVVHTAAGHTEIPALPEHEAVQVRDRLAGLIRTPDDV
jgi:membrane protein YdbS with pleckstrin-like domain